MEVVQMKTVLEKILAVTKQDWELTLSEKKTKKIYVI